MRTDISVGRKGTLEGVSNVGFGGRVSGGKRTELDDVVIAGPLQGNKEDISYGSGTKRVKIKSQDKTTV